MSERRRLGADFRRKAVFTGVEEAASSQRRVRSNGGKGRWRTKEMSAVPRSNGGGAWKESVGSIECAKR